MERAGVNNDAESKKILIVDDDPEIVQLLESLYQGKGYQAISAYHGAEALEKVNVEQPDVIILDVLLPDLDGWEVFQQIRARSDVPVIFLTALSSAEYAARALKLGVNEYIQKPFHPAELFARTEALLNQNRLKLTRFVSTAPGGLYRPTVSVIIPTLNEADNLPLVLPYLPLDRIDEVILVDGRSTDGTVEVARQLLPGIKVILEPKKGKGAALRAGYRAATSDIIIVLDADGSHDPRELPRYIRALMEGADFARGSRFAPGGGTTDMPRFRQLGNGFFVKLVNVLFCGTFTDITFGYHAFWRYCLNFIDYEDMDGFEYEIGVYVRALKARLRIVDVPSFEGYRFTGVGKLQTIPDGFRILGIILKEWFAGLQQPTKTASIGFQGNASARNWSSQSLKTLSTQHTSGNIHPFGEHPFGRKQNDVQLLRAILRGLTNEIELPEILQTILQVSLESMSAASGSIVVLDERGEVREGCLIYDGETYPLSPNWLEDIIRSGLAGYVAKHRTPVLVQSTTRDPRWLKRPWEESEYASRSALGIPLLSRDRVVGVLTLVRPEVEKFTEDDLALLARVTAGA